MDETKIYSKLLEHDERLERLEEKAQNVEVSLRNLQNSTDKILHIVERLDTERATTNYKLDQHEQRITKIEQQAASA